jgi:hypothetical protein
MSPGLKQHHTLPIGVGQPFVSCSRGCMALRHRICFDKSAHSGEHCVGGTGEFERLGVKHCNADRQLLLAAKEYCS